MLKKSERPPYDQLPYSNEFSLRPVRPTVSLLLRNSTMFSVFSIRRNSFHIRKMWLEVYNLFLKEEIDLEICLHHTVLLKTLSVLDVHQLVQHRNVLSTIFHLINHLLIRKVFPMTSSNWLSNVPLNKTKGKKHGCTYSTNSHFHIQKPYQYCNLADFE